jgi:hypothetical protein
MCDVVPIGGDGLCGIIVSLLLFARPESGWAILLGAAGAMLLDPLQFVHAHFPREPLRTLQRLHGFMHAKQQIKDHLLLGVGSQLVLLILVSV